MTRNVASRTIRARIRVDRWGRSEERTESEGTATREAREAREARGVRDEKEDKGDRRGRGGKGSEGSKW